MSLTLIELKPLPELSDYEKACEQAALANVYDYVMHPERYLHRLSLVTTEEQRSHLNWDSVVRAAVSCAEELAERYRDSGHGFGSSDSTYELMSFLREIGYIVAFVKDEERGFEVGKVIGRRQHSVGWNKTGTIDERSREPLDFFGPGKNYSECWDRIAAWRQSEREQPGFAEKHGDSVHSTPSYFFDIQVLSTTDHRYPGFENIEAGRW